MVFFRQEFDLIYIIELWSIPTSKYWYYEADATHSICVTCSADHVLTLWQWHSGWSGLGLGELSLALAQQLPGLHISFIDHSAFAPAINSLSHRLMKLNLTVITYGLYVFLLGLFLFTVIVASTLIHINSKERCVQIEMRPVIPAAFVGNEDTLNQWAHVMAMGFIREVKHTERWSCNFCGEYHLHVLHDLVWLNEHLYARQTVPRNTY